MHLHTGLSVEIRFLTQFSTDYLPIPPLTGCPERIIATKYIHLVCQIVRVYTDAVSSDQTGKNSQKLHFAPAASSTSFMSIPILWKMIDSSFMKVILIYPLGVLHGLCSSVTFILGARCMLAYSPVLPRFYASRIFTGDFITSNSCIRPPRTLCGSEVP